MASAIARGWESLVAKDCQASYLSVDGDMQQIKLKKDYIPGLGDSADLVVVGGRYDTKEVWAQREKSISWTTFYLACLINKEEVLRSEAKPIYQIVASITRPCLSVADLRYLNRYGHLHQMPFAQSSTEMELQIGPAHPSPPTELFIEPVVLDPSRRAACIRKNWPVSWVEPAIEAANALWENSKEGPVPNDESTPVLTRPPKKPLKKRGVELDLLMKDMEVTTADFRDGDDFSAP